jgi:hypothetical protein
VTQITPNEVNHHHHCIPFSTKYPKLLHPLKSEYTQAYMNDTQLIEKSCIRKLLFSINGVERINAVLIKLVYGKYLHPYWNVDSDQITSIDEITAMMNNHDKKAFSNVLVPMII